MRVKKIGLFILLWAGHIAIAQKNMPTKITVRPKGDGTQWKGVPKYESQFRQPFDGYRLVGVGLGTANYYGDMASYRLPVATILKNTRWNIGATYTKYFTDKFSMRLGLSVIRIMADDANFENGSAGFLTKYSRGLHFRNTLKEGTLVGIFDFSKKYKGGFERRADITPYALIGLSLANHNPKAREAADPVTGAVKKEWLKLRQFDTEGQSDLDQKQYSTVALSVPFGMGLKFKISPNMDFAAEGRINYTFNNGGKYLDDVSENYIAIPGNIPTTQSERFSYRALETINARTGKARNMGKVTPPDTQTVIGAPAPRGNGRQDIYFLSVFQLNYYLPSQIRCRN